MNGDLRPCDILRERQELMASLARRQAEGCQLAYFYASRHLEDELQDDVLYPSSGFIPFYRSPHRAAERALQPGRDIEFCSPGVLIFDRVALSQGRTVHRYHGGYPSEEEDRIGGNPIAINRYLIGVVTDADLDAEFKARQQDHFVAKIIPDEPPPSKAELKRAKEAYDAMRKEQQIRGALAIRASIVQLIAQRSYKSKSRSI